MKSTTTEAPAQVIGLNGPLHCRIRWISMPSQSEEFSSWWPGFFYENYDDIIMDVNRNCHDLRTRICHGYTKFREEHKTMPSFALVLKGDTFILRTFPLYSSTDEYSKYIIDFYENLVDFDNLDELLQSSIEKAIFWLQYSMSLVNKGTLLSKVDRETLECSGYKAYEPRYISEKESTPQLDMNVQYDVDESITHPQIPTHIVISKVSSEKVKSKLDYASMDELSSSVQSVFTFSKHDQEIDSCSSFSQNSISHFSDDELVIHPDDDWPCVYMKMKAYGWKYTKGNHLHSFFYVKPGSNVKGGTMGQDFFSSESELKEYAKEHYGWKDQTLDVASVKNIPNSDIEIRPIDQDEQLSKDEDTVMNILEDSHFYLKQSRDSEDETFQIFPFDNNNYIYNTEAKKKSKKRKPYEYGENRTFGRACSKKLADFDISTEATHTNVNKKHEVGLKSTHESPCTIANLVQEFQDTNEDDLELPLSSPSNSMIKRAWKFLYKRVVPSSS